MSTSQNNVIVDKLTKIAEVYKSQGVTYKYKAYRTAIDTIKACPFQITAASQLKGDKGIGKAMLEKIDEIIRTGGLEQEKQVTADPVNTALRLFTSVHGIGPVLARQLVDQGHRTLEDLQTAHLPAAARMGLAHYKDGQERIPFNEVEEHLAHIRSIIQTQVDRALVPVVCGSHRRLGPTSGDVDVLLTHPFSHSEATCKYIFLHEAVKALRAAGYITDVLAEGPSKFMGYAQLPSKEGSNEQHTRRLDVRWVTYDQFFPALMYFTGSDMFNINMRAEALKQGYTLNEYRLLRQADNTVIPIHSEAQLFAALGQQFVPPVERSK